jgi:trigger factor
MQKGVLKTFKIEKKPGSLVLITGELPFEELSKHRTAAIKAAGKDLEINGFRKGHVPEQMLIQTLGEMAILTEMAERALNEYYPEIVKEENLDAIGYPKIKITKIAKGNPLGFTIEVAVLPDIALPDYFKIAKKINAIKESKEVTDAEVTKQIEDILRQKVAYERLQEKAKKNQPAEAHAHEHHDHGHAESGEGGPGQDKEHAPDIKLPELTDEYVKGLGKEGQFTSVENFKNKIKEHLTVEKGRDVNSRHRAKITDAIIEKTKIELPQVMIDVEINQMFAQMNDDLTRAQLKMEDYLGHIKKTKEDLIKEWTPSAEKRAKLQLVLNEIAKKENIKPDQSLVDNEVAHLLQQYKDADERRVRVYVESVLTNEAVLKKLEE